MDQESQRVTPKRCSHRSFSMELHHHRDILSECVRAGHPATDSGRPHGPSCWISADHALRSVENRNRNCAQSCSWPEPRRCHSGRNDTQSAFHRHLELASRREAASHNHPVPGDQTRLCWHHFPDWGPEACPNSGAACPGSHCICRLSDRDPPSKRNPISQVQSSVVSTRPPFAHAGKLPGLAG